MVRYDHTMLHRTLEYLLMDAVKTGEVTADKMTTNVTLPETSILFLECPADMPDHHWFCFDGKYRKRVEFICMNTYTVNELIDNRLYILMPFIVFLHPKRKNKQYTEKEKEQIKEDLVQVIHAVQHGLDRKEITGIAAIRIMRSLHLVMNAYIKDENLKKEVNTIMSGNIIHVEGEEFYFQGKNEGRAEGKAEGKAEGIAEGMTQTLLVNIRSLMESLHFSPAEAMNALQIPRAQQAKYLAMLKAEKN